ncbi:hypothetical protein Pcinc_010722 [Petrolisthes cinctipes]|uniref:Uncharacterized protein n=1 Tax=Petrolisthes cinctipes TaxID=88211 RepID=A0AAE1KV54_PETCI|nr:hypothetical protein Pcinc_010722 [Petrolisthes cinctipes]
MPTDDPAQHNHELRTPSAHDIVTTSSDTSSHQIQQQPRPVTCQAPYPTARTLLWVEDLKSGDSFLVDSGSEATNMAYSGPATLAEVEADLNLSEEEDIADKHWPPLKFQTQLPGPTPWQPKVDTPYPASQPTTSTSSKGPEESI